MSGDLPAITGPQLIKLLDKDGWENRRKARHGRRMRKQFKDRVRVTVIPEKNVPLPDGTLSGILGPSQTNLRKKGLKRLIDKHGLR